MALVILVMLLIRQTNLFLIILWVFYADVAYRSIVELIIFESELAYYFNLTSKIINLSICFQKGSLGAVVKLLPCDHEVTGHGFKSWKQPLIEM